MEYTIKKLGDISGLTTRALRYYDEIGILKPARINSSGYRIYGESEVDKLQQILFYRELGLELQSIIEIINSPTFDLITALKEHHERLLDKRKQLDLLIENVNKTIAQKEGRIIMENKEKFEGFKKKLVSDNEEKYGKEIRQEYGEEIIDDSNARILGMTEEKYSDIKKLEDELMSTIAQAFESGNPGGELGQKAADLHRQWINFYWGKYSKEAHAGLAQMYVDDERFKAYYDKVKPGTAEFLRDAIQIYTGIK